MILAREVCSLRKMFSSFLMSDRRPLKSPMMSEASCKTEGKTLKCNFKISKIHLSHEVHVLQGFRLALHRTPILPLCPGKRKYISICTLFDFLRCLLRSICFLR